MIFAQEAGDSTEIVRAIYEALSTLPDVSLLSQPETDKEEASPPSITFQPEICRSTSSNLSIGKRYNAPCEQPSPFEISLSTFPAFLSFVLDFLGDPVAVCRFKMVNRLCLKYVDEHEHVLMRDAVRLGGLQINVRPSFWLWVTLEKDSRESCHRKEDPDDNVIMGARNELTLLERKGREGKWNNVIHRDVLRSFGNLPPHKSGARLRTDSIVRALATWGRSRILKSGIRGSGDPPPPSHSFYEEDDDDVSLAPTDTVSDWGAVSPVGSVTGSFCSTRLDGRHTKKFERQAEAQELALGGSALSDIAKARLQEKLSFILHVLAATYSNVGYCQGMDYVAAHLLRILEDTIRWKAVTGNLPSVIQFEPSSMIGHDNPDQSLSDMYAEVDKSSVVEETCFRVMDSFFTTYGLRHFYWPELRCLKTSCLVFEKLVQIKLPVLADHFEHHELNIGLFALGWFQTLFLYLPSMPAATVCHMWDIWLVERNFKIFFRVGTAILFLCQPVLLNNELEGMMGYLNTFPDATLLSPDILIACALQIKVTNRMLTQIECDLYQKL
jgi:hypothetical protein